ncbi:hypothetical protein ACIQBJ_13285 [Kitasatospora sp. NPDC088391]|uniref:hypothetical protein n=1 Tax=Kitasatospora sp. NPDC088391 TaxID=3364074 RepID=UPI00382BB955
MTERQPDAAEIQGWLLAVAEGRADRDAADRWAERWVCDDGLRWGERESWALMKLLGIDLRHGPDGPYLHSEEQVREWVAEFRRRGAAGE